MTCQLTIALSLSWHSYLKVNHLHVMTPRHHTSLPFIFGCMIWALTWDKITSCTRRGLAHRQAQVMHPHESCREFGGMDDHGMVVGHVTKCDLAMQFAFKLKMQHCIRLDVLRHDWSCKLTWAASIASSDAAVTSLAACDCVALHNEAAFEQPSGMTFTRNVNPNRLLMSRMLWTQPKCNAGKHSDPMHHRLAQQHCRM